MTDHSELLIHFDSADEERQDELFYASAGRALREAHRFERHLKGLASLVYTIHHAGEDPDITSFSKLSIGPMLDTIRSLVDFEPRIGSILEEARTRRNALCHSYFEDRREDLTTFEGRRRTVIDLLEAAQLFDDAADFCIGLLGILTQHLEEILQKP